jgi:threonine aldolase
MDFASDTTAPAHPAVLQALSDANTGTAPSYGADDLSAALHQTLEDLFETPLDMFPVVSGTAANALALSLLCPPIGGVYCHEAAHIAVDERGAPEFFTGGGKLIPLPGEDGKISPAAFDAALKRRNPAFVHETPGEVLSLTNLTEAGTVYAPAELAALIRPARAAGLSVHMDGARFANALVSLKASPADLSWKAGVDVLTLGLTKTGALGCDIIILFGAARARKAELLARAKRAGHMPPKLRYLSAQALALFDQGLWLDLAGRANRSARRLGEILSAIPGVRLARPVHGNEVFAHLPEPVSTALTQAGARFYAWPDGTFRFVCSWATGDADLQAVRALFVAA